MLGSVFDEIVGGTFSEDTVKKSKVSLQYIIYRSTRTNLNSFEDEEQEREKEHIDALKYCGS